MRFLDKHEMRLVSGAEWQCTPQNSGSDAGISNTSEVSAQDIGPYYEYVVAATSQLIEKVANALR
jgi:hypothetical protein